jgi:hypothetical protein
MGHRLLAQIPSKEELCNETVLDWHQILSISSLMLCPLLSSLSVHSGVSYLSLQGHTAKEGPGNLALKTHSF